VLPRDEKNPCGLTRPSFVPADGLILWLAHKEAKALIGFDAAPPGKK
jgi:hypothetical protein